MISSPMKHQSSETTAHSVFPSARYIALARSAEGRGDAKSAVAYATVVTSLFDDDELCAEAKKIIEAHKEGAGQ